ncbi:MAG: hypothetical protein HUJ88_13520 [Fusobacterium necrophorum]|nr:hypothetical protein [Fusobacterium necrophorum]
MLEIIIAFVIMGVLFSWATKVDEKRFEELKKKSEEKTGKWYEELQYGIMLILKISRGIASLAIGCFFLYICYKFLF